MSPPSSSSSSSSPPPSPTPTPSSHFQVHVNDQAACGMQSWASLSMYYVACRKVHLFDIDIPGKMTFKESLTLSPGQGPTVVDTEVGRLGIGICYDIRFPELAWIYAQRGCQLLVYPGESFDSFCLI
jgi:hypothetical protein